MPNPPAGPTHDCAPQPMSVKFATSGTVNGGNCYGSGFNRHGDGGSMLVSQMTPRLLLNKTFEEAVQTILDDVIALLGAE